MILGLVWTLILRFQVPQKKDVNEWVLRTTNEYLQAQEYPEITNVDKR